MSAQRERHQFLDTTLDRISGEVMGSQAVQAALGPELVERFIDITDNYCVPNKRDNTFYLTQSQIARDAHPILAVHADEPFRFSPDFANFSEQQIELMLGGSEALGFGEEITATDIDGWRSRIKDGMMAHRKVINLKEEQMAAGVIAHSTVISDPRSPQGYYEVVARPTQIMAIRDNPRSVSFFHELVHVLKAISSPIRFIEPVPFGVNRSLLEDEVVPYTKQHEVAVITGELEVEDPITHVVLGEVPRMITDILALPPSEDIDPLKLFSQRYHARRHEIYRLYEAWKEREMAKSQE